MEVTAWRRAASNQALQAVPWVRVCLFGGCYIAKKKWRGVTPLALYRTQWERQKLNQSLWMLTLEWIFKFTKFFTLQVSTFASELRQSEPVEVRWFNQPQKCGGRCLRLQPWPKARMEAEDIPRKCVKLREAYRTFPGARLHNPTPGTSSLEVFCICCYSKHDDEKQEHRK